MTDDRVLRASEESARAEVRRNLGYGLDPMTRPSEAEVKPIAELLKNIDKREAGYSVLLVTRAEYADLHDALESQAERIAELGGEIAEERARSERRYEGMMDKDAALERVRALCDERDKADGAFTARIKTTDLRAAIEGTQQCPAAERHGRILDHDSMTDWTR